MATRVLSRRVMREQHAQPEQDVPPDETPDADAPEPEGKVKKPRVRKPAAPKPAKEKAPARPRVRKKLVKDPPRMFARWVVFDNGMRRVAVFPYKDRAGAEASLAEVRGRKGGTFFLNLVKDPYDPPAAEVAVPI